MNDCSKEGNVRYSYLSQDSIKGCIENCKSSDDLIYIIDKITLWKVNRQVVLSSLDEIEKALKEIKEIKKYNAKTDEEKVRKALKLLTSMKGIRLPLASTILNFYNSIFPICDQRAYRAVYHINEKGDRDYPMTLSDLKALHNTEKKKQDAYIDLYIDYMKECADAVKKLKGVYFEMNNHKVAVTEENIDKYLYALDEQMGKVVKR